MYYRIRSIVAGIAGSQDDRVLPPALEMARRTDADLHLVHAPEVPDVVWKEPSAALADAVSRLGGLDRAEFHFVPAPPGLAIASVAQAVRADLVVVGSTRRHPLAGHLLGSTARRVVRDAEAPTLVLRGSGAPDVARVLVATDLSPLSAGAYEVGLDIVESLFPGESVAVRALQVAFDDPLLTPTLYGAHAGEAAEAELEDFVRSRRARTRPVESAVRFGTPVREILDEVERWGAELVVLGSHGRTAGARVLLGSTAEGVLGRTEASVLVVPRATVRRMTLPVPTRRRSVAALRA